MGKDIEPKLRSWSVLDFENDEDLREALENVNINKCSVSSERFCPWKMKNLDTTTSVEQKIEDELKRLKTLKSYSILDTDKDMRFERLTSLASRLFHSPISLITFVDMGRQWFLSNHGLVNIRETPRYQSFCAHAILSTEDLLIVNDATKDDRFKENMLVRDNPEIRFYAGAPLICPEKGHKLGTLCIVDTKPRPEGLSLFDKQNLREIAALAVENLVQRKKEVYSKNEDIHKVIASTAHDLLTPLFGIQLNLSLLIDDSSLWGLMNDQQRELVQSASSCTDILSSMCHTTIDSYRGNFKNSYLDKNNFSNHASKNTKEKDKNIIMITRLVNNLRLAIEPYPKRVPVIINVAEDVPSLIKGDEVKILSSVLNYLTNACQCTEKGDIKLRIFKETQENVKNGKLAFVNASNHDPIPRDHLAFEVEDSGPSINLGQYPDLFSNLGLDSVATHVKSLGGEYGFLTKETYQSSSLRKIHSEMSFNNNASHADLRKSFFKKARSFNSSKCKLGEEIKNGNIFWFSVPIILPSFSVIEEYRKTRPEFLSEATRFHVIKQTIKPVESNIFLNPQLSNNLKLNEITEVSQFRDLTLKRRNSGSKVSSNKRKDPLKIKHKNPQKNVTLTGSNNCNNQVKQKRSRKALVIDDSTIIRKSVDRALKKLGFEVVQAENGMVGLQKLKENTFDLVFCDFLMPVMDGLDCVQQYRKWEEFHRPWFHQYIIGISAHASSSDADCGLTKGMNKFQSKPLLLKTIKELATSGEVNDRSNILDQEYNSHEYTENQGIPNDKEEDVYSIYEISKDAVKTMRSSGLVCLIAEHSKSVGKTLEQAVKNQGYETIWVGNGEDALSLLKMRNWDIVFLDESMPKLSGISCVARFRQWESRNRIVRQNHVHLISPNRGQLPLGFDGVFEKPFKLQLLYKILDEAKNTVSEILLR